MAAQDIASLKHLQDVATPLILAGKAGQLQWCGYGDPANPECKWVTIHPSEACGAVLTHGADRFRVKPAARDAAKNGGCDE